jgi:hypothetical protein
MLWKNLMFLAAFAWLSTNVAFSKVVSENVDDATSHKYQAPHAQKAPKREVAAQRTGQQRDVASEVEVKYWQMQDSQEPLEASLLGD